MPDFLKTKEVFNEKDTISIQPTTIDGVENFALWSNAEKKFYRDGDKVKIDGKEYDVNKYIKLSEEQKTRFARNMKVNRTVLYDGKEVVFPMAMSADEQLKNAMSIVEKMGKNPLDFTYNVTRKKTGSAAINVEYQVTLGDEVKSKPQRKKPSVEEELDLDEEENLDDLELTDKETKVIEAIKRKIPEYPTKDVAYLAKLISKNIEGIDSGRAKNIVTVYLR
jgi:hypothetical protein